MHRAYALLSLRFACAPMDARERGHKRNPFHPIRCIVSLLLRELVYICVYGWTGTWMYVFTARSCVWCASAFSIPLHQWMVLSFLHKYTVAGSQRETTANLVTNVWFAGRFSCTCGSLSLSIVVLCVRAPFPRSNRIRTHAHRYWIDSANTAIHSGLRVKIDREAKQKESERTDASVESAIKRELDNTLWFSPRFIL